ncbi:putative toxin-antitoxin system toxin component, PIN family [Candidatus Micrarchaeota archaeon]|nr:putative toxin-antitoxin system toxin component, PIN family [Candidatus Micrarchaeota archaeon]MBU2476543.1 putative toxin-antitoxin system toxin component, PIN family [Candidatus Micrarchaeota archaeon]
MFKVIFDSNILLSGLFFKGNERKLLEKALLKEIQLLIPEHVLIETRNIIERKSKDFGGKEQAMSVLQAIINSSKVIPIKEYRDLLPKAKLMIRDKKDSPILAAVLSTKHDFFISGDKDFRVLKLKTHISSRELLSRISKQ